MIYIKWRCPIQSPCDRNRKLENFLKPHMATKIFLALRRIQLTKSLDEDGEKCNKCQQIIATTQFDHEEEILKDSEKNNDIIIVFDGLTFCNFSSKE